MKPKMRFTLFAFVACLLLGATVLSGCDDNLVREDGGQEEVLGTSKFRHAHLLSQAVTTAGKSGTSTGLLITMADTSTEGDKGDMLERYDQLERYQNYHRTFKGMAVWVPTDSVDAITARLEREPKVKYIEPDVRAKPVPQGNNGNSRNSQLEPWGLEAVGATQVASRSASGVEIYVIDSGVSNGDINVVASHDFTNDVDGALDKIGHGTHIAGLAAAIDDTDGVVGVTPSGGVRSLKVVRSDGYAEISTVIAAIEFVTAEKAARPNTPMVVNISLGADVGTSEYNALDDAIRTASAQGVVFVVAAGNSGVDAANISPAHTAEAITVGAYGRLYQFASFSNYGAVVDILAPGVDLTSVASDGKPTPSGYAVQSGTSMAAGLVTGSAAFYLASNPTATPQQVRDAIVAAGRADCWDVPAGTTVKTVWLPTL